MQNAASLCDWRHPARREHSAVYHLVLQLNNVIYDYKTQGVDVTLLVLFSVRQKLRGVSNQLRAVQVSQRFTISWSHSSTLLHSMVSLTNLVPSSPSSAQNSDGQTCRVTNNSLTLNKETHCYTGTIFWSASTII